MAIKATLRYKRISKNRRSIYIDYYPAIPHPKTGKMTRREFLGLYLYDNTKNPLDKQHNSVMNVRAEQIRQLRENELNKHEIYSWEELEKVRLRELGEQEFLPYFLKLVKERKSSNYDNWVSASHHLEEYINGNRSGSLKFKDLNEGSVNGFKSYLLKAKSRRGKDLPLSRNSAQSYFNKVKAALAQAYKDGILQTDLNAKLERIKDGETRREYLTMEELTALVRTPLDKPMLKKAALFSALTGLRWSDIVKLRWKELEHTPGQGYTIKFTQKKTGGVETMPIPDQAFDLMGERKGPEEKVFDGLKYSTATNDKLREWVRTAGITKHITFHSFRHTYATLQLSLGTDMMTISKMLGHRDLKTTQIYAKVLDKAKREAANKMIISDWEFKKL